MTYEEWTKIAYREYIEKTNATVDFKNWCKEKEETLKVDYQAYLNLTNRG